MTESTVPDMSESAECPLCHAGYPSMTAEAIRAGGEWRCTTCGQDWDSVRLATVAAYAAWVAEREITSRIAT
jgi:hypothetical protein